MINGGPMNAELVIDEHLFIEALALISLEV